MNERDLANEIADNLKQVFSENFNENWKPKLFSWLAVKNRFSNGWGKSQKISFSSMESYALGKLFETTVKAD